ncbi:hypothetical protein AOQ84DRAFT_34951 [Glonium stellatum]|uniref:Uncharacterized protein n=1 Tax=Glonium stellatum TaxID=574774 RepID=A0A8E2JTA3_9PEZI|nr:hypothetical protein AOQ84DRAFT_34951 [Glonium stellatum]
MPFSGLSFSEECRGHLSKNTLDTPLSVYFVRSGCVYTFFPNILTNTASLLPLQFITLSRWMYGLPLSARRIRMVLLPQQSSSYPSNHHILRLKPHALPLQLQRPGIFSRALFQPRTNWSHSSYAAPFFPLFHAPLLSNKVSSASIQWVRSASIEVLQNLNKNTFFVRAI